MTTTTKQQPAAPGVADALATAKRKGLGAIKIENAYVLRAMVIITDPRS